MLVNQWLKAYLRRWAGGRVAEGAPLLRE